MKKQTKTIIAVSSIVLVLGVASYFVFKKRDVVTAGDNNNGSTNSGSSGSSDGADAELQQKMLNALEDIRSNNFMAQMNGYGVFATIVKNKEMSVSELAIWLQGQGVSQDLIDLIKSNI